MISKTDNWIYSSDDALFEVSESFEYEADDDLETPDPDPVGRQVGNRPKRPGKGKHSGEKLIKSLLGVGKS